MPRWSACWLDPERRTVGVDRGGCKSIGIGAGPPRTSQLDERVVVRPSPIAGLGLFAERPIGAGEPVAELGGTIVSDAEVRTTIAAGRRYDGIALEEDRNLVIEPDDWPGRHGNHSCDPNLGMRGAWTVAATRDIATGEELTIDYALHTVDPAWHMACRCGSRHCRRMIRGDDWRLPDLQVRYRGLWAPVVERRVAQMRAGS